MKLDFDNYTAKLKTEEIREDEEKHKRNQIKLQKATSELDNMTSSILECMDEFDGSKPNLLATEFSSAFACIYHFTSTSSCLISRLLPNIPMAASTLCSLYDADSILKNESKYLKAPDIKLSAEKPTHTYDLMSIFRKTPPPAPLTNDEGNSITTSPAILNLEDKNPPAKPPKMMSKLHCIANTSMDSTEASETSDDMLTPIRRMSLTKQKATFTINMGSVDDDDDNEEEVTTTSTNENSDI